MKIVLGCFPDIAIRKVSKSQTDDSIVSLNINATPKNIV
jgi:hypothetical protein